MIIRVRKISLTSCSGEAGKRKGTWVLPALSALFLALSLALAAPAPAATQAPTLSAEDEATLTRIENYLNGIRTLSARFIQVTDDGRLAEGSLALSRPGKMRFEYDPPIPILMVADGFSLLYYDKELEQATFLPLWETPLWFLIRDKVVLRDSLEVTGIELDKGILNLGFRNPERADEGEVTLVFSDEPLQLIKWRIEDPQGFATEVSLLDLRRNEKLNPALFDYDDLPMGPSGGHHVIK
jgi:outer membrane lipoprotein-sorting protein